MAAVSTAVAETVRPHVGGKFIYLGDQKRYVRGVTYGPFRPDADGAEYYSPDVVERDFATMAVNGINAVRTYTVPPRWLLDTAQRHGLRVMVGLPVERYIGFLADKQKKNAAPDIEELVRTGVRACAGHPAVLCYAIGNEIGLDSRRNGEAVQARVLDWQVRTAFAAGCAGAFVYAWADEWYRAGADVDDWDFGLTRRNRRPKPALRAVRQAFDQVPLSPT